MDKKVSIILPTYNGIRYLHESVSSCLDQSYKNIELIIVDDGSTEDISATIKQFNDPRLHVIRNSKNMGLPASLNIGFKASSGDYFTWTSDDNRYKRDAIRIMLENLENTGADFVYCNYTFMDDNGNKGETIQTGTPEELDNGNCVGPCFLYKRKVYEMIGEYDPDCMLAEDYDYWLRIRKRFTMKRIDQHLYYFRIHELSLTGKYRDSNLLNSQVEKVRRKNLPGSTYFFLKSRVFFASGNYRKASVYSLLSIFYNPANKSAWNILLKAISGKIKRIFS